MSQIARELRSQYLIAEGETVDGYTIASFDDKDLKEILQEFSINELKHIFDVDIIEKQSNTLGCQECQNLIILDVHNWYEENDLIICEKCF